MGRRKVQTDNEACRPTSIARASLLASCNVVSPQSCFFNGLLARYVKPLISNPDMHHDTCITHVSWCTWGSLIHDDRKNVPGIPGACATRIYSYLARGPWPLTTTTWVTRRLQCPFYLMIRTSIKFRARISNYIHINYGVPLLNLTKAHNQRW